ncbi:MAG: 4-hydroxy-3-methylbut-2-enyl diphosphate reductase [Candidatus Marinimicrobia bacterium]|nr:4-hydroxy-3-methylbut-2-enyl diphosphate reductase [Candidatus Neomarinimicrobiota bacterium]
MKVTLARGSGFCFGVRDAVEMAHESAGEFGNVFMLGDIVHNEHVVHQLDDAGVLVVNDLDKVEGAPVLFRAHGTSTDVWKNAEEKGLNIIDATCPLVTQIHEEVKQLAEEGRQVFIIGDHGHDEVVGIASQVEGATVLSTPEEAEALRKMKRIGVVSQSTQTIENVQEILNVLVTKAADLRFINTICFPTTRNQNAIKELSSVNDVMIIIGSFTSANTKRLTSISRKINENTYQVQTADDLENGWFSDIDTVGVSAGASTPDILIQKVISRLNEISIEIETAEAQPA